MESKLNTKNDPLFDLIKSLSKAEKRNFKLYALRGSSNNEANFVTLFDAMDYLEEYDELKLLKKTSIDKRQLANTKAHLYKQILISVRLINTKHSVSLELREQIDFAKILYDKGLYRQSLKILDKAKKTALDYQQITIALEIVEFEKSIETLHITRSVASRAEQLSRQTSELCSLIDNTNELSNISIQIYSLYLKLGYVRSERDLVLVRRVFKPKLDKYMLQSLSFLEKVNLYQAQMWYSYIQYDFKVCYKYACKVIDIFKSQPLMISMYYDLYLKAYSRMMEMLFLIKSYDRLKMTISRYETDMKELSDINTHAVILSKLPYYFNKMNLLMLEGSFEEGRKMVPEIEEFLRNYDTNIDVHYKLLFYYKIACIYFGNDEYKLCIKYLQKIITTKQSRVRLDIQCFARILNLIASYESNQDYNIDYQIRSVYAYILRMNDMHSAQKEIISFLKKMNSYYALEFKQELNKLYNTLKPLETHPYERRPFFYLDIISWLESKIKGIRISDIIKEKFKQEMSRQRKQHI